MPRLLRSQFLFLNSANRTNGVPAEFSIDLGVDASIACDQTQSLSVELVDFSMFADWSSANASTASFGLKNLTSGLTTNVTLPYGTYSFRDLANAINDAYAGVYCAYDRPLNKLIFDFSGVSHQIILTGKSYQLLGFAANEVPSGSTITSTQVLRPRLTNSICVQLGGVTPAGVFNADNLAGAGFKRSMLLLSLPINAEPFDLIRYQGTGEFRLFIHENQITKLFFRLIGFDNQLLDYVGDWTAALKISVWDEGDDNGELATRLDKLIDVQRLHLVASQAQ